MSRTRDRIHLNRATKDQLASVPGLDEDLAARIIGYRKVHGGFRSLDELERLGPLPGLNLDEARRWLFVDEPTTAEARNFLMHSPAFDDGSAIPEKYTCDGENIAPPLAWKNAPPETRSFVLIMEDVDAPEGVFRHWGIYDISAGRTALPEASTAGADTERLGMGLNDFGRPRYDGPCPRRGGGGHQYHFRLAALDVPSLRLPERPTVEDVWQAAQEFVLGQAELVGTYER